MLNLRLLFCYLLILAVAVQSAVAIAEISALHHEQDISQHQVNGKSNGVHQDSDHHSQAELITALASDDNHSDADHPECHYNHCHHSSLVYLDVSPLLLFNQVMKYQVTTQNSPFSSFLISPDLRPPIV